MKKLFRFLLIAIGIFILILGIIAIISPNKVMVTRITSIKAPQEVVFEQITDFRNWKHWSPWYEMDSNMAITYYGNKGDTGSGYHWVGTKEGGTGVGDMKNEGILGDTMKFLISFKEPWESTARGYLIAHNNGDGTTTATWIFLSESAFPHNMMNLFMDRLLGKDFERGLERLKLYSEAHSTDVASGAGGTAGVTTISFPGHTYAIVRRKVDWANMDTFFSNSYKKLEKVAGASVAGYPSGIYYEWNEDSKYTDMAVAMPVKNEIKAAEGIDIEKVPASVAYQYILKGSYNGMTTAHAAIGAKIKEEHAQPAWVIEEYIAGPFNEKDTTKWVTNIIYLKK